MPAPAEAPIATRDVAPAARLENVHFTYPNGTKALGDLDLTIPSGRVTAIVGPSGCGKSTMLRLLTGFATPDSGEIKLDVARSERHGLSMVFQHDTLLPWLTVRRNVELYFRFTKKKPPAGHIDSLLAMVGLEQFADAYPRQLSGGMRRRVAFLTGVAPQPQMVLLDEPFSSVDEPTRVRIHQDVLEIVRRLKMTTVLVTHDLAEAISLSDRVAIFSPRPGRVVAIHDIPFGDDRDVLKLRDQPEFLELYGRLWHDLSAQIARQRTEDEGGPVADAVQPIPDPEGPVDV